MNSFISFNEIQNISVNQLIDRLYESNKKIIGDLKLIDLIYEKQSMTGVYIIFDKDESPVYIGKTGSRAILERLAAHLDLRPGAYMNSFLCALAGKRKQRKGPHATEEDLKNVYENALTHKFVFIQIPNTEDHKKKITKLEGILAKKLKTIYNTTRGKEKTDINTLIKDL